MASSIPAALFLLAAVAFWFYLNQTVPTKSNRVHNFSAGPSQIDEAVLTKIQGELLDYEGTGMSFMEISHRDAGGPVQKLIERTAWMLKTLLEVPDNYHILFMHGGAHGQFSAVPMNLASRGSHFTYIINGFWSQRAAKEAANHGRVVEIPGVVDGKLVSPAEWKVEAGAAYVHLCASETIHGIEYLDDAELPDGMTLVADFTSTLLSRPVDVSKYGIIYASSGKNLGPSGVTIVIIRKDLVGDGVAAKHTPTILNYHLAASSLPIPSLYNTPSTFQIYSLSRILEDLVAKGGLDWAVERAKRRADLIYNIFDQSSGFYTNNVHPQHRSRMSIPFRIKDGDKILEKKFVTDSQKLNMTQLAGHPLFGGLRITLYNGISDGSVDFLAKFLIDFAKANQK